MSLDKRSIELGTEGWGVKEDNLLAFRKDRTRYVEKPFTFSRGTAATRVNSSGLIETLHGEATNLLLHSNQFDTTWANTNTSEASGYSGIYNSNDAWLLTKTVTAFSHMYQYVSASGIKTTSIYAKANTLGGLRVLNIGGGNADAYFDLINGTVISQDASTIQATIESVGNGWYRCSFTDAETITQTRIYPLQEDGSFDGTGSIYIQHAQLESGYFATPYIETTTQAVTQPNKHETPRISYDIVDGVVSDEPHLLLEPARTNMIPYSEDFSTWSKQNFTLNSDTTTAPDGSTVNGYNFGDGYIYINTVNSLDGVNEYTNSIYIKANKEATIGLRRGGAGSASTSDNIILTTEWVRYSATSVSTTVENGRLLLDNRAINGYGESDLKVFIFGAQLELGSYATSYIPNYGNANGVTRAAETANNCGAVQDFNDDEGVLYAEISTSWSDPISGVRALAINDGGQNNSVNIYFANNNTLRTRVYSGGALQAEIIGDYDNNRFYRVATSYKANEVKFFINGNLVGTDTSATMPVGLSKLNDFRTDASTRFAGRVKELKVYTEELNDAELRLLTKYAPKDYDAAFTADYVDSLVEFTVLRTEATDKLYYSISDGTNSVSGSATITATQVTISNIDISSLSDGTLTLSVYIEDERKQRGVTVTDTTIKDTVNTPLYSYALQQRATGATFEDLDNAESIIESLNVEV